MYSKNLNKDSPQTAELLNIIPSSRLIQSWENPPADIFLLQSSFFNYSSRSITILQKQKRKTKKHNSATYVSFLIFSFFPCICTCSSYVSLHLYCSLTSCIHHIMSNLLIQGVVISGRHAENFRKWDSTLNGVLEDPYGQFLSK